MVEDYLASTPWNCDPFCVAVDLGTNAQGQREVALVQGYSYDRIVVGADGNPSVPAPEIAPRQPLDRNATVEVREETNRYIYVNGQRVGQPLD
jgi:hypothetical protein